jgi:dienelactone hydrolase
MRVLNLMIVLMVAGFVYGETPLPLDHSNPMLFRDDGGQVRPVRTAAEWARRRVAILQGMQEVMGPLPDANRKVPPEVKVLETVELEGYTRRKIEFAVEKGDRISAYVLIPNGLKGKAPAMLCLHQTIKIGKGSPVGIGDRRTLFYAVELVKRGYVTMAPDYPYFGDNKEDPYAMGYASATMKGIWNHMRCVDLLQSMAEVDGERIGCIGHSLGGHNTLFLAVFDERIKAAVTSCGFTSFPKYYNGNLTGWSSDKYMPRIAKVYGKDPKRMPFDFPEVLAAIAPRAVMVSAALHDDNFDIGGVRDCLAAARPVFELLGTKEKLQAEFPDSKHEFPDAARAKAYAFLDAQLGKK